MSIEHRVVQWVIFMLLKNKHPNQIKYDKYLCTIQNASKLWFYGYSPYTHKCTSKRMQGIGAPECFETIIRDKTKIKRNDNKKMHALRFCIEPKWCKMLMLLIAHRCECIYIQWPGPNLYLQCIFMNNNLFTNIQKSVHSQMRVRILSFSQIWTQKLYWIMSRSVIQLERLLVFIIAS